MILLTQQINRIDNTTRANGQTKAKRYTGQQPTGNGYDDFNSEYTNINKCNFGALNMKNEPLVHFFGFVRTVFFLFPEYKYKITRISNHVCSLQFAVDYNYFIKKQMAKRTHAIDWIKVSTPLLHPLPFVIAIIHIVQTGLGPQYFFTSLLFILSLSFSLSARSQFNLANLVN